MPEIALSSLIKPEKPGGLLRMPILLLHLHSRCNCRCTMCDIWKQTENTELTLETLERQRDSLLSLGVQHVVFTGGEPFMNTHLPEIVGFFQQLQVRMTVLTSGLLLARHADLIVRSFHDVILSLDGPPAVHDQIRGVTGAFEKITTGVRTLKQLSQGLPIHARCTVQQSNFALLADTVTAAWEIGLDGISFLAADLSSSAFNRELIWPVERKNKVAVGLEEIELLEGQFDIIDEMRARLAPDFTIAESRPKLQRIADHFRAEAGLIPHRAPRCNAPWISGVWETDGTLRPCFFHQPIGNIGTNSLEDALNSEAALHFRSNLQVDQNEVCRKCVCSLNYRGETA